MTDSMMEGEDIVKKAENTDRGQFDSIQEDLERLTKASTEFGYTPVERGVTQIVGAATGAAETATTPTREPQTQPCPTSALKTKPELGIEVKVPPQTAKGANTHMGHPKKVRVVGCLVCDKPISVPLQGRTQDQVIAGENVGNQHDATLGKKRMISNDEVGDDDPIKGMDIDMLEEDVRESDKSTEGE